MGSSPSHCSRSTPGSRVSCSLLLLCFLLFLFVSCAFFCITFLALSLCRLTITYLYRRPTARHWIYILFAAICTALVCITNMNMTILNAMYTTAFLSVMSAFVSLITSLSLLLSLSLSLSPYLPATFYLLPRSPISSLYISSLLVCAAALIDVL